MPDCDSQLVTDLLEGLATQERQQAAINTLERIRTALESGSSPTPESIQDLLAAIKIATEAIDSGERELTTVVATVTASGDTDIHAPASGKRVRIRWIIAINDPTSSTAPVIKIKLGSDEKYRVWALSKRQRDTGPIDGKLTVNLSQAGNVLVTARIEEVS